MALLREARTLTAPLLGRVLAGGWALYWNDLTDGATRGSARAVARLARGAFGAATTAGATRRWFRHTLGPASERRVPERAPAS